MLTGSKGRSLAVSQCGRVKGAVVKKLRAALSATLLTPLPDAIADVLLHKKAPVSEAKVRSARLSFFELELDAHPPAADPASPLAALVADLRSSGDAPGDSDGDGDGDGDGGVLGTMPLALDESGGKLSKLVPSVFLLWLLPPLLPTMRTHAAVLTRLQGGADLMLPGVVLDSPDQPRTWTKGALTAVVLTGSDTVVAVGECLVDADHVLYSGMVGKAMAIKHVWGDALSARWPLGHASLPASRAGPAPLVPDRADADADADASPDVPPDDSDEAGPSGAPTAALPTASPEACAATLTTALLNALKTRHAEIAAALPLEASTLLSAHITPCRPVGETVNVKGSTFRKLTKFLREMEAAGALTTKNKGKGTVLVTSIAPLSAPILAEHVATRTVAETEAEAEAKAERRAAAADAAAKADADPFVLKLMMATKRGAPLFAALHLAPADPVVPSVLNAALRAYVRDHGLDHGAEFALDALLDGALTNKARDAHVSADGRVRKADILALLRAASAVRDTTLVSPPYADAFFVKGPPPTIAVTLANRGGNRRKATTVVANLAALALDPAAIAADMATACAASTSTRPPAAGKGGDELVIQGDAAADLVAHLGSVYAVPSSLITITDKRKGKSGGGRGRGRKR